MSSSPQPVCFNSNADTRDLSQKAPIRAESAYKPLHSFALEKQRSYKQQFGDMYFLRLTKIKPAVEEVAAKAWEGTEIGGERATRVERVLDVRQGELCWVAGTVYMDMRLKPNILEDVSKDVSIFLLFGWHVPIIAMDDTNHQFVKLLALAVCAHLLAKVLLRRRLRSAHAGRRLRPCPLSRRRAQ